MDEIVLEPPPPNTLQLDTVAIIYTGGTIGMKKNEEGEYAPDGQYLLETMRKTPLFYHTDLPKYHVMSAPPLLDSANMSIDDWYRIARIIESIYHQYCGFVVIHGTDTLAYTASILSFILINLHKPVVVTGSQLPLCEAYTDGYFNLQGAIRATTWGVKEVCVFFNNKLMRGNRVQKYSAWSMDAFDSASMEPLVVQGIDLKCANHIINGYAPIYPLEIKDFKIVKPSKDIAMMVLYPGFQPQLIRSFTGMKGLVVKAYGTGNGPFFVLDELKQLHSNGCVIVIVTQTHTGRVNLGAYEAASPLRNAGCLSGYCMTPESAYCKLSYLWGLGLDQQEVEKQFCISLRGEFDV